MITPGRLKLNAYRNGYAEFNIQLTDNYQVMDLRGCQAEFQVRTQPGAEGDPLLYLSSTDPTANNSVINWPDAEHGFVSIAIQVADLKLFPCSLAAFSTYVYDLVITQLATGHSWPFLNGQFVLNEGVSR